MAALSAIPSAWPTTRIWASVPGRRADARSRHGAEHGAAVGAHEQPLSQAQEDEPPDQVRQREVHRELGQAQQREGHDGHARAGQDPRPEAIGRRHR